MKLVLLCSEEKIFEGIISEVSIITPNGPMVILPGHEPYLTKISDRVTYKQADGLEKSEKITDGFVYTDGENCFVVVDDRIQ